MEPRIAYNKYSPNALHALYALEKHLKACGLEEKLLHLIKMRASQINGCAYCLDMHSKEARAAGETEQPLRDPAQPSLTVSNFHYCNVSSSEKVPV